MRVVVVVGGRVWVVAEEEGCSRTHMWARKAGTCGTRPRIRT